MKASSRWIVRYVGNAARLPLPPEKLWLTDAEQGELAHWHDAVRRQHWLYGRWIAKRLIVGSQSVAELRRVEILSRDGRGRGTSPRIFLDQARLPCSLSISHAAEGVLVGLRPEGGQIGVDLALDVPHHPTFRTAWFTPQENDWLQRTPRNGATLLWGLKEAVFKACADGHSWTPRRIEITSVDAQQVIGRLDGRTLPPLGLWTHRGQQGTAMVVWETKESSEQEGAPCS